MSDAAPAIPLIINDAYLPLFDDDNRFNILVGGSGSGKSVFVVDRYLYRLCNRKGYNVLVTRKTGRTNRFSTFALFKQRIQALNLGNYFKINETEMHITCLINKNMVVFFGLDDTEKVKSFTFPSGILISIWMEEANETFRGDYIQLNLRLRGSNAPWPFQLVQTLNPVSHDLYQKAEFFDKKKDNATTLITTYLDNAFCDEEYKRELEELKETDPILYDIYAKGKWGQVGELAFPRVVFEPCRYKKEDFDIVVFGQDFGFQHYDAIEGIGIKDDELWSYKELYVRQKMDDEIIELNEENGILDKLQLCTCDSAEPKAASVWRTYGYNVVPSVKGPKSVENQYRFLRNHVWHIDEMACPGLASEVRGACYLKKPDGSPTEEVFSIHNDALAAARYAIERLIIRTSIQQVSHRDSQPMSSKQAADTYYSRRRRPTRGLLNKRF